MESNKATICSTTHKLDTCCHLKKITTSIIKIIHINIRHLKSALSRFKDGNPATSELGTTKNKSPIGQDIAAKNKDPKMEKPTIYNANPFMTA